MDKKYWENYYTESKAVDFPSPFAEYCVSKDLIRNSLIVDIGCGNGRDSFYFLDNSAKKVVGIDQSEIVISKNIKNIKNLKKSLQNKIKFYSGNFVNPEIYTGLNSSFYYSRFTLHAIKNDEQLKFIVMLGEIMNSGDICAIEARTINDNIFNQGVKVGERINFTDHHRCFLNPSEVISTIIENKFELVYFEESINFAIYKGEKPSVMRLIFKRI